ncbi:MAG: DUF3082 domain-containing protein [Okeania sp. SIO2D1]|nr:DUF3082 domain-containing protein [Okeania sp. SIO2D1]
MSNSPSPENLTTAEETRQITISPWHCLLGSVMAGGLAIVLYSLTSSVARTLASKPIPSSNITAINISVAVRTLVIGTCTLGTGIFALVSLGLIALMVQILWQKFASPEE